MVEHNKKPQAETYDEYSSDQEDFTPDPDLQDVLSSLNSNNNTKSGDSHAAPGGFGGMDLQQMSRNLMSNPAMASALSSLLGKGAGGNGKNSKESNPLAGVLGSLGLGSESQHGSNTNRPAGGAQKSDIDFGSLSSALSNVMSMLNNNKNGNQKPQGAGGGLNMEALSGIMSMLNNNASKNNSNAQPQGGGNLNPAALSGLMSMLGGNNSQSQGAGGVDPAALSGLMNMLGGNKSQGGEQLNLADLASKIPQISNMLNALSKKPGNT